MGKEMGGGGIVGVGGGVGMLIQLRTGELYGYCASTVSVQPQYSVSTTPVQCQYSDSTVPCSISYRTVLCWSPSVLFSDILILITVAPPNTENK
jgi:hypothetical protein